MRRRSPAWLLVCALALATGLTLLQLSSQLADPSIPGTPGPLVSAGVSGDATGVGEDVRPLGLRQPVLRTAFDRPPAPLTVGLARLTFAPGAWLPAVALSGPALFAAEAGTLTIWADGEAGVSSVRDGAWLASPESLTPEHDLLVRPGNQVLLLAGTTFALRNTGATPAVALGLAMLRGGVSPTTTLGRALFGLGPATRVERNSGPESGPEVWPPGVIVQPLAGTVIALAPGPTTLRVDRWVFPPMTDMVELDGEFGLVVVESGVLRVPTGLGTSRIAPAATEVIAPAGAEMLLGAGEAMVVPPAAVGSARNAGDAPLVVLILTIAPEQT